MSIWRGLISDGMSIKIGETAAAARGRGGGGDGFPRQPAGCLGLTGCPRLRARRRGTRIANQ